MLRKAFAFIVSFFDKKKHHFTFQLANTAEKVEETVHRSAPRQQQQSVFSRSLLIPVLPG